MNIQKSIRTPTPKVGVHLRMCGFIPKSMKCDSQVSLVVRTFASLCFNHEPKVKVVTLNMTLLVWSS